MIRHRNIKLHKYNVLIKGKVTTVTSELQLGCIMAGIQNIIRYN